MLHSTDIEERKERTARARTLSRSDRAACLSRTIEAEIIPRLLLVHTLGQLPKQQPAASGSIDSSDVAAFADLLARHSLLDAQAFVARARSKGVSLEATFLELFTGAARWLGQCWCDDRCNFGDVTIGVSRLHQLVTLYTPEFEGADAPIAGTAFRSILLVCPDGEQHGFGLCILEAFFRRAGWVVRTCCGASQTAQVAVAATHWFDIIGVSSSYDRLLDSCACTITALRRASMNRKVSIMLGGRVFSETPGNAVVVGADAGAIDARQAVVVANMLAQRSAS